MPETTYGTVWVCVDCMLHHANGECGSCHDDHGHDEEPLGSVRPSYSVAMGMDSAEHACGRENGEDVDGCDCEIRPFSTSQCGGCGSYLYGDRHAMTLFGPAAG